MSENTNTAAPKKFKRGTIGAAIQKLVAKCRANPMQFYILEQALVEACGVKGGTVCITDNSTGYATDLLVSRTPGYKQARTELDAILARYAKVG